MAVETGSVASAVRPRSQPPGTWARRTPTLPEVLANTDWQPPGSAAPIVPPFTAQSGVQLETDLGSALDAFHLIFTEDLYDLVVAETNRGPSERLIDQPAAALMVHPDRSIAHLSDYIQDFTPEKKNKPRTQLNTVASRQIKDKVMTDSESASKSEDSDHKGHSSSSSEKPIKAPRSSTAPGKPRPKPVRVVKTASSSSSSSDSSPDRISEWKKKDIQRRQELEERHRREQEEQLRHLREEEKEEEERKKREKAEKGKAADSDSDSISSEKIDSTSVKRTRSSSASEKEEHINKTKLFPGIPKRERNKTGSDSDSEKKVKKTTKKPRASEPGNKANQKKSVDRPRGRRPKTDKAEKIKKKPNVTSEPKAVVKEPTVEEELQKLHSEIKFALKVDNPDVNRCLDALEKLGSLQLTSHILQKNTDLVTTLKKIRRYKANQAVMDKAAEVYSRIKARILGPKLENQQKGNEGVRNIEECPHDEIADKEDQIQDSAFNGHCLLQKNTTARKTEEEEQNLTVIQSTYENAKNRLCEPPPLDTGFGKQAGHRYTLQLHSL
ncbi:hepatoma-derived growth factor-related protein 2-like [Hyperolius riggenbachi]|uniref:hepatoma-derived growth factor-related protein 2-like n=1 Tax=Hyperolius riggenbachi TaxID=752182 RepID=UPI0035A3BCB8